MTNTVTRAAPDLPDARGVPSPFSDAPPGGPAAAWW